MVSVIGYIAAALSVASFLPQAWRIIKTRETKDLATSMWICSTCAFVLWSAYGVVQRALPIVIPNVICALLAAFILTMKLLPPRKRDAVADAVGGAIAPNH